jgi:SAM-dependent methyltransferase
MRNRLLAGLRRLVAALFAEPLQSLRAEQRKLREGQTEMRLMLRRLEAAVSSQPPRASDDGKPRKGGGATSRIPLIVEPAPAAETPVRAAVSSVPPQIAVLDACPVCGHGVYTQVCEYNKFFLLDHCPDDASARYDYAMCHRCGVTFARRRPIGERYQYLVDRFEETIGRVTAGETMHGRLTSRPTLTDAQRAELQARAAGGVFVSEHLGVPGSQQLPALFRDRMGNSHHIELLTSLLTLRSPRVLELRPRFGAIGAGLKRAWQADVWGLPLFENQQLLNREVYGHRVDRLLDYDDFSIPYEGQFDLIVANHIVTHAVRPKQVLSTLASRLNDGGYAYFYNEPDDAEFLDENQSMFNVLNAFHLQTFDRPSLLRALGAFGFEPVFVAHDRGNLVVLARLARGHEALTPMSDAAVAERLAKYSVARDMAILRVPERRRAVFADEWPKIVERAFLAGRIEMGSDGKPRVKRGAEAPAED